jgi:hypothetical protein
VRLRLNLGAALPQRKQASLRLALVIDWPPILCIGLTIAQGLALPARLRFLQGSEAWVVFSAAGSLVVLANLARWRQRRTAARRLTGALVILLSFLTARSFFRLLGFLLASGASLRGWNLLHLASNVWVNNVLTFALCYWFVDRGGPAARAAGEPVRPEWMFPEMAAPELARPGWRPGFPEYLFLALTTATAFSPTDTAPLSLRARALMGAEALLSLVTLALVAARAVNILG